MRAIPGNTLMRTPIARWGYRLDGDGEDEGALRDLADGCGNAPARGGRANTPMRRLMIEATYDI